MDGGRRRNGQGSSRCGHAGSGVQLQPVVSLERHGDMRMPAHVITARKVRMKSTPFSGIQATERSPVRTTPGTSTAWSARAWWSNVSSTVPPALPA